MKSPLLFVAFSAFTGLLSQAMISRFERAAAADISSKLQGEHRKVEVDIQANTLSAAWGMVDSVTIRASQFSADSLPLFTEPERSQVGHVDMLRIELSDFDFGRLHIQSLSAAIPNCRFDQGLALRSRQVRLSRSGVGTGSVQLNEKDLERFVLKKYKEIKRVSVRIDRGKVWVEGYGEFLIAKTDFEVIADLRIENGTRLHLDHAKIYLNWVRADEPARNVLLKTLNPIVDLNRDLNLFDAIQMDRIELKRGTLTAFGSTRIPVRPSELAR